MLNLCKKPAKNKLKNNNKNKHNPLKKPQMKKAPKATNIQKNQPKPPMFDGGMFGQREAQKEKPQNCKRMNMVLKSI